MSTNDIEKIIRDEKLEYFREWRAKNKDKVKKYNETYWKKRAIKILAEQEKNKHETN